MSVPIRRTHLAGLAALALAGTGVAVSHDTASTQVTAAQQKGKVVRFTDARLKFEVNATDRDSGMQIFLDGESWKEFSIFDPSGKKIFTTTASGSVAKQGGAELFVESSEPTFSNLPIAKLLKRFPEGRYQVRGTGIGGERYVGTAILTHDIPDGPTLVSPLPANGPQNPNDTTVTWKPVPPPNGSPIIGYQVLVVQPKSGIRTLPKITLDVTMPPTATSLKVPPGFLAPNTEYEWEVLAIERGGNQTLSSSTFTTTP